MCVSWEVQSFSVIRSHVMLKRFINYDCKIICLISTKIFQHLYIQESTFKVNIYAIILNMFGTYSFNKHLRNDYDRSDTMLGNTGAMKTRGKKLWTLCSESSCPLRKPVIQTEKLLTVVHRGQSHKACLGDQERLLLRM